MTNLKIDPTFEINGNYTHAFTQIFQSKVLQAINDFNNSYFFDSIRFKMGNSVSQGKNIYVTAEKPQLESYPNFPTDTLYVPGHFTIEGGWTGSEFNGIRPTINYENAADEKKSEDGAGFVYLGLDIVDKPMTTLTFADSTGGSFEASLLRILTHEITHAATITYGYESTWRSSTGVNFAEEIAFSENAYYVPHAIANGLSDINLRLGHTTYNGRTEGGITGTSYFVGMDSPYMKIMADRHVEFRSVAIDFDTFAFETLAKTYHRVGHSVLGNQYDRYITVSYSNSDGLFHRDHLGHQATARLAGAISDETTIADLNAVLGGVSRSLDVMEASIHGFIQDRQSDDMTAIMLNIMGYDRITSIVALDQTRSLSIGTDRFFDDEEDYDTSGPVALVNQGAPSVVAIDDRLLFDYDPIYGNQFEGTAIFGAGGYDKGFVDLSSSSDLIHSGDGDDLLVAGSGGTPNNPNFLFGNLGNDIFVGGSGHDVLNGGAGSDLFVQSEGGNDMMIGDLDFDVVSYASADFKDGVFYDGLTGTISANGFAKIDTIAGIEAIIGSPGRDAFISNGNGIMLIGGAGDDVFHMANRDVVIGGDGNDAFKIDVKTPGTAAFQKFLILGFDLNDELWIDGQRFYGSTANAFGIDGDEMIGYADALISYTAGGVSDPFASSYLFTDEGSRLNYWTNTLSYGTVLDAPGDDLFSLITISRFENGVLASSTEIFITGFKPGDGDINYSYVESLFVKDGAYADPGKVFFADVSAGDDMYGNYMPYSYPDVASYFAHPEQIAW